MLQHEELAQRTVHSHIHTATQVEKGQLDLFTSMWHVSMRVGSFTNHSWKTWKIAVFKVFESAMDSMQTAPFFCMVTLWLFMVSVFRSQTCKIACLPCDGPLWQDPEVIRRCLSLPFLHLRRSNICHSTAVAGGRFTPPSQSHHRLRLTLKSSFSVSRPINLPCLIRHSQILQDTPLHPASTATCGR